ncbi:MAG: hypothetical protein HKN89_06240 [Eudoraea sp.]|nr:hypothetical protein [Eudoraea sp.]
MSKIALIGITLFSVLAFSDSSPGQLSARYNSDFHPEGLYELVNSIENLSYLDDCTVTTHGYIYVDGVSLYVTLRVDGPCDSRLADKVRAAIRALRGIK